MLATFFAALTSLTSLSDQVPEEYVMPHVESASPIDSIQLVNDHQDLIQRLYRHVNRDEGKGASSYLCLDILPPQNALEHLPSGSLIFLGTSLQEIHTLLLSLENGQCSQISSQNGQISRSITPLNDFGFGQFPYCAVYIPTHQAVVDDPINTCLSHADTAPFLAEQFECYFVNELQLPFVISPRDPHVTLAHFHAWVESHQPELQFILSLHGAILLRGFPVDSPEEFASMVKAVLGRELIDYKGEGSRQRITQGVYTSTEAPPEFKIPLHNELTCTINPIDYICFYCDVAPKIGTGQTLLGKTEVVTREMMKRPHIWNLFNKKNIKYISRHPPEGSIFTKINCTHRSWPQAFETTDKKEVEEICQQKRYEFKWNGEWIEVTRHVPAIRGPDAYFDHPYWFNQAHLYHSNPRMRGGWTNHLLANLLYIVPSTRQYDVEFDDGSKIPQDVMYEIYDIMDEKTIRFNWQKNDVLLLDNHKTLHGRAPCAPPRRILVAMVQ